VTPNGSCVVIGAGGFLGTNLCRRLVASGARVRAFSRQFLFPRELEGAEVCQGDFTERSAVAAAVEGHELVFHLIQDTNLDASADLQRTLASSLALLEISRDAGVKRVVFVSSGGVIYGPAAPIPTPETAPTGPITAHGISKLAVEKYLALHEQLYGLDYRVLRVTNAFGPFQIPRKNLGLVAALISRGLAGERIEIWGDGSVVRDYVFVSDVVDALEAAAVDRGGARIFNIGTGQGRSVREVIAAVETQLATRLRIDWTSARSGDVPTSVVSIERARTCLGWTPKTSFEDGMNQTIAWWRSRTRINRPFQGLS
jgi:UDP-glucose 4-epimerase